ncbi:hypothetical protein PG994_002373 [Apiospora phragmitis]|uniref:Heterokaryon incompatibility domain-containing protein n=1 Tax=Apiospora phragmitis TaxID=2905665 RepID=A0ABR1WW69_9PEZI
MTNCRTKHASCQKWQTLVSSPAGLPTRLIRIEHMPGLCTPVIRLVRGLELDTNTQRYATLSHCWDPNGVAIKLLSSNIDTFLLQIPWSILPLTFQEAILAATRLGIEYIWIDALCIMQDSTSDWTIEASKMMQPTGVVDCSDSEIQPDFNPKDQTANNNPYYCHVKNWDKYVETAPLKTRSWVTQERFMSPRVVHFSNDQVDWECVELMKSECVSSSFHVSPGTIRTPERSLSVFSLHTYSIRKQEKLYTLWPIAIAGLARTFAFLLKLEPKDYLCGLWRPYMVQEMMWYTFTSTERASHSIPSWSLVVCQWRCFDKNTPY